MGWPESLQTALKEWATVCGALAAGRQIVLRRKGGIYESGGEFELDHPEFLLFPTYLHQNLKMLKPEAHAGFEPHTEAPDPTPLPAPPRDAPRTRRARTVAGRRQPASWRTSCG